MSGFTNAPGMMGGFGGGSPSGLIEKYLGEAYANVLKVADGMPDIQTLIVNLASINAVASLISSGVDFQEATWGQIIGTITEQTDLTSYITDRLSNYQTTSPILVALSGLVLTGNADKVIKVKHDETGLNLSFDETGTGTASGIPAGNYGDITANEDSSLTVNFVGGQSAATIAGLVASKLDSSQKGIANGVCPLDATSKISATFLPSYVDDVLEVGTFAGLPSPGEAGKIYVTLDTNFEYRWSGSTYIRIVASPGSTDALAEGGTNLYFTNARAVAALTATLAGKADLSGGTVPMAQMDGSLLFKKGDGGVEGGAYYDFHAVGETGGTDFQARIQANTAGQLDISTRTGLVTVSGSDLALATNNRSLKFMGASGNYSSLVNQSDGNFVFYATNADGSARAIWSIATHSNTSVFQINPDVSMAGNLVVTGEITSPSDERLKTNIEPILNASELIAKLAGYRFDMNDTRQIGVIAQHVQKVLPELVQIDEKGMLSVAYHKLTAVLISDNNSLRRELGTLEARLARLEQRGNGSI